MKIDSGGPNRLAVAHRSACCKVQPLWFDSYPETLPQNELTWRSMVGGALSSGLPASCFTARADGETLEMVAGTAKALLLKASCRRGGSQHKHNGGMD